MPLQQLVSHIPELRGVEQRAAEVLTQRFGLPMAVVEPVEYLLLRPGKGLRPALVYAVAQACGASTTPGLRAIALAAEMIHVGSLLHDDIVDGASLRRAAPAAHLVFDPTTAVLSGDVLVGAALRLVAEDCTTASLQAAGRAFYALASAQAHETRLRGQVISVAEAQAIAVGKTGALFAWICSAAACEAGHSADAAAWWQWGEALGLAFQIADDLNDRLGVADGKDVGLDAQRQTPSLVDTLMAADASGRLLQQELERWMTRLSAVPSRGPLIELALDVVRGRLSMQAQAA